MICRLRAKSRGFTLIEVLIVLAIMGLVGGYIMFNFPAQIVRWRLLSSASQVASVLQRTRLEAVRRNATGTVRVVDGIVVATIGDLTFSSVLEGGIRFEAPEGEPVVDGFGADGVATFRVDGTVEDSGAFRLASDRGYFVEVRVDPPATGRTEIRKWDPVTLEFAAQDEGGKAWQW